MTRTSLGSMRHRLTLEDTVVTPDGGGGSIVSWSAVATVWAAITPRSGVESFEADARAGRVTHEIVIRWRDDVHPRLRFRLGARLFDIKSVIDPGEARRFLTCLVEERIG